MEITLDALNWEKLTAFGDSAKFAEWRLECEDDPDWILSFGDVGWENDSARTYYMFAETIEKVSVSIPSEQRAFLRESLMVVVSASESTTIQDFPCIPDSCYFISLSPSRVLSITESLTMLDRQLFVSHAVAVLAKEYLNEKPESIESMIEEYLTQIETLIQAASARKWGIIGHCG